MSHTLTIRLTPELAEWLADAARRSGVPQGRIVRDQLERARADESQAFLQVAGTVDGATDLSTRKGFSKE